MRLCCGCFSPYLEIHQQRKQLSTNRKAGWGGGGEAATEICIFQVLFTARTGLNLHLLPYFFYSRDFGGDGGWGVGGRAK